jgi:hypothetical protein
VSGFGRLTGARRGDVADERMIGGVEELDGSGVGQKNVATDRNGRPITPPAELAPQCGEQRSFVLAAAFQKQLLDLIRRAADVGSEQWISFARQAGDIEDTLEPAGVRIDDRLPVTAQAMQLPDEMLVAVNSYRPTQLVAGGDRVGAGGLFAKQSAV